MRQHTGWVIGLAAVVITVLLGSGTSGHTAISSRFTYNEHLFPVFQRQCGSCHVEGGVAPMSLLTYREAYPWTQSIREEVLSLRMPPWKAEDGFGDFANGHILPAHEMDMILEWSAGGYPQGPRDQTPVAAAPGADWTLGDPTLELTWPAPFKISAATSEILRYFVLPTDIGEDRWVTGVDVMPESRAVVRHVSVYVDTTGQARAADEADAETGFATGFTGEHPIAVWWPGQRVVELDAVGYALPSGADIVARVLYKKTWITEGQAFTDQTRLGLHLREDGVGTIEHTALRSPDETNGNELVFSHTLDQDVKLLGILPELEIESTELQIVGVRPDGSRQPLLLIREPDSGWPTRYWFESPQSLLRGSQIEVTATLRPGAAREPMPSLFAEDATIRLLLEYIAGADASN